MCMSTYRRQRHYEVSSASHYELRKLHTFLILLFNICCIIHHIHSMSRTNNGGTGDGNASEPWLQEGPLSCERAVNHVLPATAWQSECFKVHNGNNPRALSNSQSNDPREFHNWLVVHTYMYAVSKNMQVAVQRDPAVYSLESIGT